MVQYNISHDHFKGSVDIGQIKRTFLFIFNLLQAELAGHHKSNKAAINMPGAFQ